MCEIRKNRAEMVAHTYGRDGGRGGGGAFLQALGYNALSRVNKQLLARFGSFKQHRNEWSFVPGSMFGRKEDPLPRIRAEICIIHGA